MTPWPDAECWDGEDEEDEWRGDQHPEDDWWPEEDCGPEYWLYLRDRDNDEEDA